MYSSTLHIKVYTLNILCLCVNCKLVYIAFYKLPKIYVNNECYRFIIDK